MKANVLMAVLILAVPVAGAAGPAPEACAWSPDLDAVVAAPDNHRVMLENEHVRVLEVIVPPHTVEPVHAHCWPSTLYVQEMGDMIERDADGRILFDTRTLPRRPQVPVARWTPPQAPHAIENPGDVPLRLIRVEDKR